MRRPTAALLAVLLLAAAALVDVRPAAAAPARPFDEGECLTWVNPETGDVYEYCYEARGVVQENRTPSGNRQVHVTEHHCDRSSFNGEVVYQHCSRDHFVYQARDGETGETRVSHSHGGSEISFAYRGTTYECTARHNFTYANGEVRHDVEDFGCTPPLPF